MNIETTHLLGNLANGQGNALSDQATTVKTYFRGEDKNGRSVLNLKMVITDPGHLTATHTTRSKKPNTVGYEFVEADCQKPLAN